MRGEEERSGAKMPQRKIITLALLLFFILGSFSNTLAFSVHRESNEDKVSGHLEVKNLLDEDPLLDGSIKKEGKAHQFPENLIWPGVGQKDTVCVNQIPNSYSPLFVHLKKATFDPLIEEPKLPLEWAYRSENWYYMAQCFGPIQSHWIEEIKGTGAFIHGYIPDYTYLLSMGGETRKKIEDLSFIRWVGSYQPGYKIESGLIDKLGEIELNVVVFSDREENLLSVRDRLSSLGGVITHNGEDNHIIRVLIDSSKIKNIALIPEVEWIDEYTPPITLMDNIRVFTGAESPLHLNGFNGTGIVGEIKDNGIDEDHTEFDGQLIATDGDVYEESHGTSTFGIVFARGANDMALGMLPGGKGVFASWGVGRKQSIANLVNNWGGLFQSNSWHQGSTDGTYVSQTQENDEAVFEYDVTMLYAAGNGGYEGAITREATAKNVIGVGALDHYDNQDRTDDQHTGNQGNKGPTADGRIKPDIVGPYDYIYTTTSGGGYTPTFGGTSGATPVTAGAVGLIYEIYRENHFGNNHGGTIPHAATVKAILIADAYQYEFSQGDRYAQGWGLVDVGNVYDIGKRHFIVDEEINLQTGESITYFVEPTGVHPLKISLVWTDVPGTTSSSQHLVNDLNLKVTDPNGEDYLGNVGLLNSKWSSTGGDVDTLNNVENVFIENPVSGEWIIEISAQNIAMDGDPDTPEVDQPFALVASGVSMAQHDLGVSEIQVPTYLAPNQFATINATIVNNGLSDETDILVNFTVDGEIQDTQIIPSLESEELTYVNFDWVPQTGIFMVGVGVEILPDETHITNNFKEKEVIVEPDLSVTNISSDRYLNVNENEMFNATINNLGKMDLTNVQVQLFINDSFEESTAISSLPAEASQIISLYWTPVFKGWYKIEIFVVPVTNEEIDSNNRATVSLFATSKDLIYVAILDSWGTDYPEETPWDFINDNWMYYGTTPVEIDYTTLNKDDISYNDLVNLDADVIMISMAIWWEFTDSEIDAITNYVLRGHGFIATSATFFSWVPNNNKLAPLFGMRDDITYDMGFVQPLDLIEPEHSLFFNVSDPYSPGSYGSQIPPDGSWDADDLTTGRYIAKSSNNSSAIIVNRGVVYISNGLEDNSNSDDVQLLYNAMIWSKWEQYLHDIVVSDIEAPSYLGSNQQTLVNATVENLGLETEINVIVNLTVDGNVEDSTMISIMESGASTSVSFSWTSPSLEGAYLIGIETYNLPNENITENNRLNTSVIVTNGPKRGRIALISDGTQLQAITSLLDDLGKGYDILDDNAVNLFTRDLLLLLEYQSVIFYNSDRAIENKEGQILNDYITLGGTLLVTGFDSLGAPNDANLADVVRSTLTGDNMGWSSFAITNGSHPITDGIYGQYPSGSEFFVGETDHDFAEADITRGAQTIAELGDGSDKIIATVLPSGGKVIYWNGNGNCDDWTLTDLEGMFKNIIIWIMPVYNDAGVHSLGNPSVIYVGETASVSAMVKNYGINDQSYLDVEFTVKNPNGFTIFTDTKNIISINSGEETQLDWLWYPSMSDIYEIEIRTLLEDDEFSDNDMIVGQITVYVRFFFDDMENGIGDWEVSDTSPVGTELWHLTTTDSYSPTTSWWCGDEATGQYTVLADQFLTSPFVNLTEATSASLRFYHKYGIDDSSSSPDWGQVQISIDGSDWETLQEYTGSLLPWTQVVLDISSYIGNQIQIRFALHSGILLTDNGWWVDDVEIFGMGNQYKLELSAVMDTIAVGKNEPAVFGIYVKNTGNVDGLVEMSLDTTNIEDWMITFSQDVFYLQYGDTNFITLTITPISALAGDYSTTATGVLKESGVIKTSDDLPLTIILNQWYGVGLAVDNDMLYLIPSESGSYNITIVNEGNGPDSILLSTEVIVTGISNAWQYEFSKTAVSLGAYQQEEVVLTVIAPYNGYPDDIILINVIGTSQSDSDELVSVSTTALILAYYSMVLSSSPSSQETEPGVPINFVLEIMNHGNTEVDVNLDVTTSSGGWDDWLAVLEIKNFKQSAFTLRNVILSITPPEDAVAFEFKEFDVKAISIDGSSMITLKTTIKLTGDLKVEVDDEEKEAENGDMVHYSITLTNMQNHPDTIDIATTSENGWSLNLFTSDGITMLSVTDSDGKPDTDLMDPITGSVDVIVAVSVPEDAIAFTDDDVTVIFASSLPNGISKTISLKTNVELSGGFLLDSESYSKSDIPGKKITYSVHIENHFNHISAIDLTVKSEKGWEVELLKGDGVSFLSDTNNNGIPDTGMLNALGDSADIFVEVRIPEDTRAYTMDMITLTGTATQSGESRSIKLNASVM
ncbi:MAG: S8 family serine peptidase, partial [Thermoplasmata archaeon]